MISCLFFANRLPVRQEVIMIPTTVLLDEKTAEFYARVAALAERSLEQVLADSLFKLAGELSLEAIAARGCSASEPPRHCGLRPGASGTGTIQVLR